MDITKITFDSFKTTEITSSFENLDVNNDGVINSSDLNDVKDTKIANQIKTLLNATDDDTELKTGATKNKYGINETNSDNWSQDVLASTGTVYVVLGTKCSWCKKLQAEIQKNEDTLNSVANVYAMEWSANKSLCSSLSKAAIDKYGKIAMPQVAKFVDGKFVGLLDNPRDITSTVEKMISEATGTKTSESISDNNSTSTTLTSETTNSTEKSSSTTTKASADVETRAKELLEKYPIGNNSDLNIGDAYSSSNPELIAFQKAVNDGIIQTLADEGFSKTDIIDIIAKAFPTIGISNNGNGGYTCPIGHDNEAKELYDKFVEQITSITSDDVKALQAKIATMNAEIQTNNLQLNKLSGSIESIKADVEEAIEKAIKESEEIKEEQKNEAATLVKQELNNYTNSNGEMTYETFQSNLSSKLDELEGDGSHKLSGVIQKLMTAESGMATLKKYVSQMGVLVEANKTLSDKVATTASEAKKAAEEAAKCCDAQRCDPIGFSVGDVQYDFFVDKDSNGKLSNEQEFLGADNGWAEMEALDTNNDGKITKDEMKDLKLVATDANCNQTVVNATDLFNDTDSIDLSSYNSVNQDMDNGNTLLGTFSLTVDGNEVTNGYNTLDEISWLDDNYNFSDEENGINRFAKDNTIADEIVDYSEQYNTFTTDINTLDSKLTDAWSAVNISRDDVKDDITKSSQSSAESKATDIAAIFKKHENCGITEEK